MSFRSLWFFLLFPTLALPLYSQASIEPTSMPTGNIDVISGAYSDQAVDHVVNCIQPIEISRTFSTHYAPGGTTADWRVMRDSISTEFHPHYGGKSRPKVTLTTRQGISVGFEATSRCSLRKNHDHIWTFVANPDKGPCNTCYGQISGREEASNYRLKFDRNRAQYTLRKGSGEIVKFRCVTKWDSHAHYRMRQPGEGKDNEQAVTDYFCIEEVIFPNGNRHLYKYDSDQRLRDVRSVNSTGDVDFGWVHFDYKGQLVTITTSDNRTITHKHEGPFLRESNSPINNKEGFSFVLNQTHADGRTYGLSRVNKPDGRCRKMDYRGVKAVKQHAPLGRDEKLVLEYEYKYGTSTHNEKHTVVAYDVQGNRDARTYTETIVKSLNWTDVVDALNNTTRYEYSKGKITKIVRPDKSYISQEWGDKKRLKEKSFYAPSGKLIHSRRFTYDPRGNVLKETLVGDLQGKGKEDEYTKTFTYNDLNLILSEEDDKCKITYAYKPGTNLLTAKRIYDKHELKKEELFEYDHNAALIKHTVKWGSQELTTTYQNRTEQPAIGMPEIISEYAGDQLLKRTQLHYDNHNQVVCQDIYDANNRHRYSLETHYNDRGQITRKINALPNKTSYKETSYTYDANGNCIELRDGDVTTTFTYDCSNRLVVLSKKNHAGEHVTEQYAYDYLHRKTESTDFSGNKIKYAYDPVGNCTKTILPGQTTVSGREEFPAITRTFDHQGNVLTETDPNKHTTVKTYNSRKQVTSILHSDGSKEHFYYNVNGELIEQINRNGSHIIYTRDYLGRILTKTLVARNGETPQTTTTIYDGPNKAREIDAMGYVTEFTYDKAGRLLSQTKDNQSIHYAYDELGRKATQRKGDRITIWTYDLLNRVIEVQVQNADRRLFSRVQYAYDRHGNKIRTTTYQRSDALTTHKTFDILGKETSSTDPLGNTTHASYDRAFTYENQRGVQKVVTNAKGHKTITIYNYREQPLFIEKRDAYGKILAQAKNTYDYAGNRTEQVQTVYPSKRRVVTRWAYGPGGRLEALEEAYGSRDYKRTTYTYNDCGQLIETRKPSGITLHRKYDDIGRLLNHWGKGFSDLYTYDRNNNVISVESKTGTTRRTYDPNGSITSERLETGLEFFYERDNQGRCIQTTLPGGTKIHYTYDAVHLRQVTYNNHTHHYTNYDLQGNLLYEKYANGKATAYTHDPLKRLTNRKSPWYSQLDITYDELGNLTSYTDKVGTYNPQNKKDYGWDCAYHKKRFDYNPRNQLTSENDHTYTYDSLNNRTKHNDTPYKINALNQIQASNMEYDGEGRLTRHDDTRYTYDSRDRLITVTTPTQEITFAYDPFNRRLSKTVKDRSEGTETKQLYLYEKNCEIGAISSGKITELRVLGRGRGAEIGAAVFIILDDELYVPYHNHQGSIVALLDAQGDLIERYDYTAYGECVVTDHAAHRARIKNESHTPISNPYRFLSKRHDPETGLTFFGRRYYNPSLGRWISPDPKGYKEGPNLYAYVNNNPLTNIDLWGLAARAACHCRSNGNWMSRTWDNVKSFFSRGSYGNSRSIYGGHTLSRSLGFEIGSKRDISQNYKNLYHNAAPGSHISHRYPATVGATMRILNGVDNNYNDISARFNFFEGILERELRMTYMHSWTPVVDMAGAVFERLGGATWATYRTLYDMKQDLKGGGDAWFVPHSRGGLHVYNASLMLSPQERARTHVRTIGSPKLFPKGIVASAVNYVAKNDFVPKLDPNYHLAMAGRTNDFDIRLIETDDGAGDAHKALGEAYMQAHQWIGQEYRKTYPEVY